MDFKDYVGEPDIDRLIRAFRGQEIDRVPNLEILIEEKHVSRILGKFAGSTLCSSGNPPKEISGDYRKLRPMYAEDYVEVCKVIGQDAIILENLWIAYKKYDKEENLVQVADRSIKNSKCFKELKRPGYEEIAEKIRYIREYKEAVKGTRIGVGVMFGALMQAFYEFIVGMDDFMLLCYEDITLVEEMLEDATLFWIEFVKAIVKEKIDFIWPADDIAFKTGTFLPPDLMRKIWVPRMERILAPAVKSKIPIIFHSDGKIDELVPDLINIGVDCIHPLDPYGIDYKDYKKKFGNNITLAGNIDIEFPLSKGTPDDVKKDVKKHMDALKPGYGYIAGSSHSIVNYIPEKNFIALINAIHTYGLY